MSNTVAKIQGTVEGILSCIRIRIISTIKDDAAVTHNPFIWESRIEMIEEFEKELKRAKELCKEAAKHCHQEMREAA